ncbi:chitinase-like protein PB1E7.04c [Mizuhopecten yessoensis]|uniref:chitinase-like protein PB1E7.04c n=1 Tax=Mizuhopecten yessoensis TaxID=6573 RepID=UPI000B459509|nr:chitinase-like protein PB1E7.04c [Mizuhopecten yessoensis]XP_021379009.1 chitinase-like protein PB1E7.04c [Mizuhopecten yessoensis]
MDFKIIFQHKISILLVLLNIINGLIGTAVPDTNSKTAAATEKPKMGCYKKFCTLFGAICTEKSGTCVSGEGCAGYCHCTKAYKGRYCQIKIDSDEPYNGHTNGKSSDNGNGNGHDNGNGRSNSRTKKKPTVGVIMKLFKGLRTNGNGNTSNSNAANGGKTLPTSRVPFSSKYPPVKAAAQKGQEIPTTNYKSGSESRKPGSTVIPRVNTDENGNGNGSVTTKINHNGNATISGKATVHSTAVNSSIGKSNTATTTGPILEADHKNITRNKTNGEIEVKNNTATSTTLDISSVETTTKDPGNIQSTEILNPNSTTVLGNKVKAAETGLQTKPDTDSVKPVVGGNGHLQLTTTEQTRQPKSKTNTKPMTSKAKPESSGNVKTETESNAGHVDHTTTSNKDTTVNNTGEGLAKSESDTGTAKTLITQITIGSSKTKPDLIGPKSAVEIPILKNSEVSSSAIADSAAVPSKLSKGEFFIRDVPVTTGNSDANQQPRTDIPRSAAQLWRFHKSSTRNEESALPMVSSGTVKSTLDDANRWVASGFEPDLHSDILVRENMALVLGKDFIEEEEVQESKSTSGNIPLGQNGNNIITSQLERAGLTESIANISKANNERHNNTVFRRNEIAPKAPVSMSIENKMNSNNRSSDNRTYLSSKHSFVNTIRPFDPSENTVTVEEPTSSVIISTTESSKAKSELPEENIYLASAVYKQFIPPEEVPNSEKRNNISNVVAPTTVVNTTTDTKMEHDYQIEDGHRVLESNIQSSTMNNDRITAQFSHVADTTPSVVVKDSDKITEILGKTLKVRKNDTGISEEDTAVTALEKLKSLLVYVQTILSSTKNDLDARKANNEQSVNSGRNRKENTTESNSDTAGSLKETIPKSHIHNRSETEQESIKFITDYSNQQQQDANEATTETAFILRTEAVETTTPNTSDSTPDDIYETSEDTFVKIPIFQRPPENTIPPTVEPVITSTGDGMLKSESSSPTTGLSEKEMTAPRRHISTSAMALILRKIYAIGNLITRPAIKGTTTVIPDTASPDTEQRAGSLVTKMTNEGHLSTSESSKISHTFDNVPNKMSAVNMKQKSESDSPGNSNADRNEHKIRGFSKMDKYFQQNKTVMSERAFYGNEDMVGNYIVDSTSTMKPYTMPPTTDPQDGELLQSNSNTSTGDSSFSKQQSDTKLKQRTKGDSVNLSSLETVLSITTVSPKPENTTIS